MAHWAAVALLVVLQFTVIPMIAIIAADTSAKLEYPASHGMEPVLTQHTVVYKTPRHPVI